jgi:hypothetical protein
MQDYVQGACAHLFTVCVCVAVGRILFGWRVACVLFPRTPLICPCCRPISTPLSSLNVDTGAPSLQSEAPATPGQVAVDPAGAGGAASTPAAGEAAGDEPVREGAAAGDGTGESAHGAVDAVESRGVSAGPGAGAGASGCGTSGSSTSCGTGSGSPVATGPFQVRDHGLACKHNGGDTRTRRRTRT